MKNNYNVRKSNAYNALHNYCSNHEIMQMMKRFGYRDDIFCVMKGERNRLENDYKKTWRNICSCKRKADSRSPMEFARDIVSAWVIEDMIREMIRCDELSVDLNGGDANRRFLSQDDVKPDSDFRITCNGKTRKIELSNDYSGFVVKNGYNDLRGTKLKSLEDEEAILLVVNLEKGVFSVLDTTKDFEAERDIYNEAYGKLCSKVYLNNFLPLKDLRAEIKKLF